MYENILDAPKAAKTFSGNTAHCETGSSVIARDSACVADFNILSKSPFLGEACIQLVLVILGLRIEQN
jgi:hypothetical protein